MGYVHTIKMGAHVSNLKLASISVTSSGRASAGVSLVEEGASQVAAVLSPLGGRGIHCSPLWYFLCVSDEKSSMAL